METNPLHHSPLPIGGYVKIPGLVREEEDDDLVWEEDEDGDAQEQDHDGDAQEEEDVTTLPAAWKRLVVLSAGLIMNLVAAVAIFFVVALLDGRPAVQVMSTTPNSPAQAAGIESGDILEKVNGEPVYSSIEALTLVASSPETVQVTVRRDNTSLLVAVKKDDQNRVGVTLALNHAERLAISPLEAGQESLLMTEKLVELQVRFVGSLLGLHTLPPALHSNVSGPIGITEALSETLWMGLRPFLFLIAQINLGLALFNLVPIPPLDGGRIMLVLVETVIRRTVPLICEKVLSVAGAALLMVLFVYATVNDLWNLFTGS